VAHPLLIKLGGKFVKKAASEAAIPAAAAGLKALVIIAVAFVMACILGMVAVLGVVTVLFFGASPTAANPSLRAAGKLAYNTLIPDKAVDAYNRGAEWASVNLPDCKIDAAFLAAEGLRESTHGGAGLQDNGDIRPKVIGTRTADDFYHKDRDGGLLDGDVTQDLAVGPMQAMPTTWLGYKPLPDGNGDGIADPHNFFDAVAGAAIKLCERGPLIDDLSRSYAADAYSGSTLGYAAFVMLHYAEYLPFLTGTGTVRLDPIAGIGRIPVGLNGINVLNSLQALGRDPSTACTLANSTSDATYWAASKTAGPMELHAAAAFDAMVAAAKADNVDLSVGNWSSRACAGEGVDAGSSLHNVGLAVDLGGKFQQGATASSSKVDTSTGYDAATSAPGWVWLCGDGKGSPGNAGKFGFSFEAWTMREGMICNNGVTSVVGNGHGGFLVGCGTPDCPRYLESWHIAFLAVMSAEKVSSPSTSGASSTPAATLSTIAP
jgi:hypothetical protein